MDSLSLHPSQLKSTESFPNRSSQNSLKPLPKPSKKAKTTSKDSSISALGKTNSEIRLTDLCPEDKARVGELVKRLALEKSQREETESRLQLEKQIKEREVKKLLRQNERMKTETEEMRAKYEKTMEILETYKVSNMRDWSNDDPLMQSHINTSIRATPEPIQLANVPISPIRERETSNACVQTVCDKEIQTNEEDYSRHFSQESPSSDAVNEVKHLKDDVFILSESVKTANLQSLRASQALMKLKENEVAKNSYAKLDDDRLTQAILRADVNLKKAEAFKKGVRFDCETRKPAVNEAPLDIKMFEQSFSGPGNNQYGLTHTGKRSSAIDKDFYDDTLFTLVDDLEKLEPFESIEEKESEYSVFSSKYESSVDGMQELRDRAIRLRQTIKY